MSISNIDKRYSVWRLKRKFCVCEKLVDEFKRRNTYLYSMNRNPNPNYKSMQFFRIINSFALFVIIFHYNS